MPHSHTAYKPPAWRGKEHLQSHKLCDLQDDAILTTEPYFLTNLVEYHLVMLHIKYQAFKYLTRMCFEIISHYKKIGYNIIVLQQTACLVVNPITVGNFAFLFNCTPVGRTSDSMMVPT